MSATRAGSRRSIVVGSRRESCDVWTVDTTVSGMHARITQLDDGRFMIEDLGSLNGTWLTNPLASGVVRVMAPTPAVMAPGTRIRLGACSLPWSVDR